MTPTVSVVIATRHRPELLRRAVDAALSQSYDGGLECIIVFDQAPVDDSLAQQGERRSCRVIANSRTPGLAGARNTGIDAATGELVAFCDDDDRWLPDKLSRQVVRLEQSGADVVVTGIRIHVAATDRSGPTTHTRVPRAADLTVTELVRRRVMEAHPSTVLVRRSALFGAIGLVDEEIPGSYGEDFDWLLRAAQTGPIAVVESPLVEVLWGATSYFQERWQTVIEAIDYGLTKHPVLSADRRGHARLLGRKAFAHAALGHRRSAWRWAVRAWRLDIRDHRAYAAVVVGLGLLSADRALAWARSRGRGI